MKTNICIDDIKIKKDKHTTVFYRDNGFQTIGNSTIGNGIGYVKSIVYHEMEVENNLFPILWVKLMMKKFLKKKMNI